MTRTPEPEYRTAYAEGKGPICPECGAKFDGQKYENVMAHREDHYPEYARDNFSDEAKERRDVLEKIAKELGK